MRNLLYPFIAVLTLSISLPFCSESSTEDIDEDKLNPYSRSDILYLYSLKGMGIISGESGSYSFQGTEDMTIMNASTGSTVCTVKWRTEGSELSSEEYCPNCAYAFNIRGTYNTDDCGWGSGETWIINYGVQEINLPTILVYIQQGIEWVELGTGTIQDTEEGKKLSYQKSPSPYSGL